MALKPDRKITDGEDISYFMNHTAERGGVVTFSTGGSGAAMDDANAVVVGTGTTASGTRPAGILMNDMVNLDLTRQHINWHKDEMQLGGKVAVLRHGVITTDALATVATPTIGGPVYYTGQNFTRADGTTDTNKWVLTHSNPDGDAGSALNVDSTRNRVGTWLSLKDADGYAKVEINLL